MALEQGLNSYSTVADANLYFETRLDSAAWSEATETQKEAALVTATTVLDNKSWGGYIADDLQHLAFPRVHTYMDPRLGVIVSISDEVPKRILDACYEIAYHLLNNDGALDNISSVNSLTVGPIRLEGISSIKAIPEIAYSMIRPLLSSSATSRIWWRAN